MWFGKKLRDATASRSVFVLDCLFIMTNLDDQFLKVHMTALILECLNLHWTLL